MSFFWMRCSFGHLFILLALAQEGAKLLSLTPSFPVKASYKRQVQARATLSRVKRLGARSRNPHGGAAVLRQEARRNDPVRSGRRNGSRK
jgi:hypothetical protein